MLKIYHAEGRRSERLAWFCEEVGLTYELIFVSNDLWASLKLAQDVNPLMPMMPTAIYNDEVLVESAAIMQLVQEREAPGKLAPDLNSPDYPKYLQWFHFAESSGAPRMITEFLLLRATDGELPPVVKGQIGRSEQVLRYLEDFLSRKPYFGGADFSMADIMMHFDVNFISMVARHDMTLFPKTMDWFKRVEARPAFKRMREVALPNGFIGIPQ
jgi:glutathione S-transferase